MFLNVEGGQWKWWMKAAMNEWTKWMKSSSSSTTSLRCQIRTLCSPGTNVKMRHVDTFGTQVKNKSCLHGDCQKLLLLLIHSLKHRDSVTHVFSFLLTLLKLSMLKVLECWPFPLPQTGLQSMDVKKYVNDHKALLLPQTRKYFMVYMLYYFCWQTKFVSQTKKCAVCCHHQSHIWSILKSIVFNPWKFAVVDNLNTSSVL